MDNNNTTNEPLLRLENVSKHFKISSKKLLKAVDNVSFNIYKGETVGLVGESGCGKSTTGRCIIRLDKPTAGQIFYAGQDIYKYSAQDAKKYCKEVQMIFQNPYSSLNPRMTVKEVVGEGINLHSNLSKDDVDNKVQALLERVGLGKEHMSRFSHEFSGGQRQRIGIARALSVDPAFIICDEPISALDVSIQAQVINMLKKLQKDMGLTYLFIAHDLSVVKYISDRVVVMYLGTVVEHSTTDKLFKNPLHPYTQVLLSSIPVPDPIKAKEHKRIPANGEIPSPINPKDCCRFAERCSHAKSICFEQMPNPKEVESGHVVSCHLFG